MNRGATFAKGHSRCAASGSPSSSRAEEALWNRCTILSESACSTLAILVCSRKKSIRKLATHWGIFLRRLRILDLLTQLCRLSNAKNTIACIHSIGRIKSPWENIDEFFELALMGFREH